MFAKATKNFLREVDDEGNLIAVTNLNDSDKLQLLSLVTKKTRFWCWQRPKYQSLSVALGDVLTEDQHLSPVVVESDFVKYEGKFANHVSGAIETALGRLKLNVGGKGLVESQSSFGSVKKQEVDLQQLLGQATGRRIDLKSPLLQQVLDRRSEVLCVLTQRIVTTEKCVISEHVQVEEKCGGMVGIQTRTVQVSAKEDGSVVKDSNVVLEIPALTTIVYGVVELFVRRDGSFEFCLLEGKCGGFENERRVDSVFLDPLPFREFAFGDLTDAGQAPVRSRALCALNPAAAALGRSFRPLERLPEPRRAALRGVLRAALLDAELLQALEQVCDDVVSGLPPSPEAPGQLKPPQSESLTAFLRLAGCSGQAGRPGPPSDQPLFSTAYGLVSALAEMPDDGAALLGTCCDLHIIPALCHLLRALSAGGGLADLDDGALAPLRDAERFGIAQRLLAAVAIDLARQQSAVSAATHDDVSDPLLLCVCLSGLRALGPAQP